MNLLTKILLPVLSLLVLLAAALSITTAILSERAMEQEFLKRGASVVAGLSSNGRMGVLLGDSTQLRPLIQAAFLDRDVRSVAFLDKAGAMLAGAGDRSVRTNSDSIPGMNGLTTAFVMAVSGEERGEFASPIVLAGGDLVGSVSVEISRSPLNDLRRSALGWTIGLAAVFIALSMLFIPILKSLLRPLRDLANVSDNVATGDLTVNITEGSSDEVGRLARSFRTMVANLRAAIGEVQHASAAVGSASVNISTGTDEMAAGAQVQTERVSDIVRIIGQMSTSIVENSHHARSTADAAARAKDLALNGNRVVDESIQAMRRMAGAVRNSAETVRALGRSSDRIGMVVSVIDDIADQTNLLALNAAIEAARAGDQGRGFAVVADEVRKLAERTTQATQEIADMIGKIQKETGEAVGAMERGTAEVDSGIVHADGAGAALRSILETTQQVTDMIGRMASASEEQAAASEEIARSVDGIDRVTREGAEALQQMSQTSEDLNRLTANLQGLVGKFSIGTAETAAPTHQHQPQRTTPRDRKVAAKQDHAPVQAKFTSRI